MPTSRTTILTLALALFASLGLAACGGQDGGEADIATTADSTAADTASTNTVIEVAMSDNRFSTLVDALQQAGLAETLREGGPYTIFAPTNAAFESLNQDSLNALLNDQERLRTVLLHHVHQGELVADSIATMSSLSVMAGGDLGITGESGSVMIDSVSVEQANIEATNGIIHAVGQVLMPTSN